MLRLRDMMGLLLAGLATPAVAGIPTTETIKCPVGGKAFTVTGTASCTTFGGSQDFFLKAQTSCDFVTKLPQCPDNGFPVYKDFTPAEAALLADYMKTSAYAATAGRSRFHIAKRLDDFLASKGSKPVFNFWYLLGGLQYDRERTLVDAEYMGWLRAAGRADLAGARPEDAPIMRLVTAYAHYLAGEFSTAEADLAPLRTDATIKDNKFAQAYLARLDECLRSKDVSRCPADGQVMPPRRP